MIQSKETQQYVVDNMRELHRILNLPEVKKVLETMIKVPDEYSKGDVIQTIAMRSVYEQGVKDFLNNIKLFSGV